MSVRRPLILVALAVFAAACSDEMGLLPLDVQPALARRVASSTEIHILTQSPAAPPLETYQVSFWAYVGRASTVTVEYQPAAGESEGRPFLRFDIPRNGLVAGGAGVPLNRGDSVLITLTIDTVSFAVDFQPSGVAFSARSPANLALWYENANPDLNGNGVVDGNDRLLQQQLAVWYQAAKTYPWFKLSSKNDLLEQRVATALYHFSDYALSW